MSVVDDGHEEFGGAVETEGLVDQKPLAVVVVAAELDLKGLAEDAQGVVIGVKGAVDDGGDDALGVVLSERFLEDGLATARFAQNQTETALFGA
jgi:hypothetical protein